MMSDAQNKKYCSVLEEPISKAVQQITALFQHLTVTELLERHIVSQFENTNGLEKSKAL